MSERGVFAMHRGWFDHTSFAAEPYTEREAWAWLISEAAYKPARIRVGTIVVDIKRGQVAHSIRYMAEKWDWKPARVQRFISRLKKGSMIDTAIDTGLTVITLCNYDKWQFGKEVGDTPVETAPIQQRYKEEEVKNLTTAVDDGATPDERVMLAIGVSEDPNWYGHRHRIFGWLKTWDLELDILPTVKRMMAGRVKPPNSPRFFEDAIAEQHARRKAPLPVAQPPPTGRPAHRQQNQRGSLIHAADKFIADINVFGPSPRGSGEGAADVRLLPGGGSERPGNIHGSGDSDPGGVSGGGDQSGDGPPDGDSAKVQVAAVRG